MGPSTNSIACESLPRWRRIGVRPPATRQGLSRSARREKRQLPGWSDPFDEVGYEEAVEVGGCDAQGSHADPLVESPLFVGGGGVGVEQECEAENRAERGTDIPAARAGRARGAHRENCTDADGGLGRGGSGEGGTRDCSAG